MKPKLKQSEGRRVEVENDVMLDKITREGVGEEVAFSQGNARVWQECDLGQLSVQRS